VKSTLVAVETAIVIQFFTSCVEVQRVQYAVANTFYIGSFQQRLLNCLQFLFVFTDIDPCDKQTVLDR